MTDKPKDVKFLDLFNPNQPRSEQEEIEARLAICQTCKYFKPHQRRCQKCGCFMDLKTRLHNASCPMGKW
jgi:uncharacterized paraquat-inducible protein A